MPGKAPRLQQTTKSQISANGEIKEIPLYPQVDALIEPLIIDYRTGGSTPAAIIVGISNTTMNCIRNTPDRPKSAFVNGSWDNPPFSKRTLPW